MKPLRGLPSVNDQDTPIHSTSGIRIRHDMLRRELVRRGWCANDLCRASGLSRPAVAGALSGKRVKPMTLKRIVIVLAAHDPVEGIDDYL